MPTIVCYQCRTPLDRFLRASSRTGPPADGSIAVCGVCAAPYVWRGGTVTPITRAELTPAQRRAVTDGELVAELWQRSVASRAGRPC